MTGAAFRRLRLLDLFGCEGGGARGYAEHFDVYGIDLFKYWTTTAAGKRVRKGHAQSRYPFPSYQGDVIVALDALLAGDRLPFTNPRTGHVEWLGLADFDAIHASPPCQINSAGTRAIDRGDYLDLIPATRERLALTGFPYVIENVEGADLRTPLMLCGTMFGLIATDPDGVAVKLKRHRLFESNVLLVAPGPDRHDLPGRFAGSYGGARRTIAGAKARGGGYVPPKTTQEALLGIEADTMTEAGLHQCIPPAYGKHLGEQLAEYVNATRLDGRTAEGSKVTA